MTRLYVTVLLMSIVISITGCISTPEVVGKWEGSFMEKSPDAGDIKMEFVLNLKKDGRYSMTMRGIILQSSLSKVFSKQLGVWSLDGEMITFTPRICKGIDESFTLSDVVCNEPETEKIYIKDDRWQFEIEGGNAIALMKKQVK